MTKKDDDKLAEKIAELELVEEYGSPTESALAAQELAKIKAKALEKEFEDFRGTGTTFDSNNTTYGRRQTTTDVDRAKLEINGQTHHSLNIIDGIRVTYRGDEKEVKRFCRENGIKYEPPVPSLRKPRL